MTARVTGLKVLKNYVYADVELGFHKDAGRVTTTVRMRADDDEVRAALQPLLDLAAVQATTVVRTADFDEQVEVRSRDALRDSIKSETERLQRNNARALDDVITHFTRVATDPPQHEFGIKTAAERAVTALRGLTGRE